MRNIYLAGRTAIQVLLSAKIKSFDQDFEAVRMITSSSANAMAYLDGLLELPPLESLPNGTPHIKRKEAQQISEALGVSLPLEVNVDNRDLRRSSTLLHSVMHPIGAPTGLYFSLDDNLFCATPALALLQEVKASSDMEAIVLMSLFFSVFTHDSTSDGSLMPRRKLLSKDALLSFAERCTSSACRQPEGLKRMLALIEYAVEDAASPAEIESALRLGLPTSMGGCGYLGVRMNYPIAIPHANRTRYVDLYWPEENVGVEYDSVLEHTSRESLEADVLHRNDLTAAGVPCFYLSADQLGKFQLFTRAAKQIGEALDAPKYPSTAVFHDKQRALAADIHAALSRYGF